MQCLTGRLRLHVSEDVTEREPLDRDLFPGEPACRLVVEGVAADSLENQRLPLPDIEHHRHVLATGASPNELCTRYADEALELPLRFHVLSSLLVQPQSHV